MNFKRVLVLLMVLAMMVSTCAPAVLAASHHHEAIDEQLNTVLNNPELVEKYEELKGTVEVVAEDIANNYKEYYAAGYAYATYAGYVAVALDSINLAIDALDKVNLDELDISEDLKGDLETELDALSDTLGKIHDILANDADNLDGLVEALLTLESDLNTHLANIYAIAEQAGVELTPVVNNALAIVNDVVIPSVISAVKSFVDGVVEYAVEKFGPYYDKVSDAINISKEAFDSLVATVARISAFVNNAVDTVVATVNAVVAAALEIYGTIENAVKAIENAIITVNEFCTNAINAIIEFNAKVENTIDNVHNFIVRLANAFRYTVNLLVEIYGEVKKAVIVANQLCNYIIELAIENKPLVEEGLVAGAEVVTKVVNVLKEAYEDRDNLYTVASQLSAYLAGVVAEIQNAIDNSVINATNGSYELKDDSYYVALGNATYASALASKLHLGKKFEHLSMSQDYVLSLEKADLVTLKLDNGQFMPLVEMQVEGKFAEVIRNSDLYVWYETIPVLIGNLSPLAPYVPEIAAMISGLTNVKDTIDETVNLEAEVVDLDWSKYLDAKGQEALDALLAKLREKLMEEGVEEYCYFDINPYIYEILAQYQLEDFINLSPIAIPQVDLIVFAVENALYGYAGMIDDIQNVLTAVSSDTTVVITGINNPLIGYTFKGIDLTEYASLLDPVVDALNTNLYGIAILRKNVVFVESEDANDIYDALHVYCNHVYDGCLDKDCNRCYEVRTDASHSFTNYVYNNDATCTKDGTKTAKCDNCNAMNSVTAPNTKKEHTWREATCTTPKTCKVCGQQSGEKAAHVPGEWTLAKDPTSTEYGLRELKCINCKQILDTEEIENLHLSTVAVVAIIVSVVVVLGAASSGIALYLKKKNKI